MSHPERTPAGGTKRETVKVMDSTTWDKKYTDSELLWSADANIWVQDLAKDLAPGIALDVAAGEGRNALWLVARGWQVTAVDFLQRRCSALER